MTDPTNPSAPKIPRKKPRRDPATIDLPAQVIDEGRPLEEPSASEAERITEAVAIEMAAPAEPVPPRAEAPAGEGPPPSPPWDRPAAETSDVHPDPSPAPQSRRSLFAPLLGAALLGGVIGASALFALQQWQMPREQQRLVALEQRIAALPVPTVPTGALAAVSARVDGVANRQAAIETSVATLDQRVAGAQSAAEQALKRAEGAEPTAQDEAALADLTRRLASLEGQLQSGQETAAGARRAIETKVVELSERLSQGPDDTTKAAVRIVLAQRLADALRTGIPYVETLAALRAHGTGPGGLAVLEPFAEKGAPTAASLAQTFEPVGAMILRDASAGSTSMTDRFLRMAERVVTVRPVNEPGGSDAASLVARIEQALARGDVTDAVAAWDALPEPSRRVSEEWGARAKARAAADAGAQNVANEALATLKNPG